MKSTFIEELKWRGILHDVMPGTEELLAKETGIRLPMHHLYHWIKGKPAPGPITAITRSETGDIIKLQQAGYTLEYSNYRDHYPYKIRLLGRQLSVKIIVKQWEIH